jgi:hypothetical protein
VIPIQHKNDNHLGAAGVVQVKVSIVCQVHTAEGDLQVQCDGATATAATAEPAVLADK